jgi:hypothetical protein
VAGYEVSPAALQQTAQGIQDTISDLKGIGIEGTADAGRGFSELSLRGMQVGHAGLQGAFGQFLDRWSWGVRTLVQDGNQIAQLLNLNAGAYYDAEHYASGTFKDITADVMGNPHLSDSQIEQESWTQVKADNPLTDLEHPDYTAQSFAHAGQDMATTWQGVDRDLVNGPLGVGQTAANGAGASEQFNHLEDQMFGPAPDQIRKVRP